MPGPSPRTADPAQGEGRVAEGSAVEPAGAAHEAEVAAPPGEAEVAAAPGEAEVAAAPGEAEVAESREGEPAVGLPEVAEMLPTVGVTRRRGFRSLVSATAVLLVAAGALTALLDALSTRFVPGNSDGATVVLEGAAMSGGNLALRGWAISLDSFWTLDALFYAVAVRIGGLHPDLMNLVPAIIAAFVIVLGAVLAREGRHGRAGLVAVGTVLVLLGLPGPDLAYFLLQGPWHVATTLAALAAFALLARPGVGWRWLAGVALLAAGVLGDVMIVTFGLLPLLAAGLVAMARRRSWRAGVWTVAAAPAAALLALGARAIAQLAGTFTLVNRNLPIRGHQLAENVGNLGNRLPGLLGVGTIPQTVPDGALGFQLAHVPGLLAELAAALVGLGALAIGAWRGKVLDGDSGPWRLDDLLVLGIGADIVTFIWAAGSNNTDYAKYLTPSVVLAAVLAGRFAGRLVSPGAPRFGGRPRGLALAAAFAVLVAALAAEVGVELSGPEAVQPARQLSTFLVAHHLDHGVGDYWSSTVVTVDSSGAVQVRPVTPAPDKTLRRYERQSPESWYAGQRFDFFVYDTARPWRDVNAVTARLTWGPPATTYTVGSYRVLVWSRSFSVSTAVPSYGSPLQIFWSPGSPRSSTARSSTTPTTTTAAR